MNQNVVDMAVNWIVYNTRYTPFQCYRVIEIISQKGEKAPYYLTKKQKKILDLLMWLFMADNETNSEPIQNRN